MTTEFQSETEPTRLLEENGLLVYDADLRLTAEQLDRMRTNLLREREEGFLSFETLAKSV